MTQRCVQMARAAEGIGVESDSDATKTYTVHAFRPDEYDHCTCIAYIMARNKLAKKLGLKDKGIKATELRPDPCKHIRWVYANTCQWSSDLPGEHAQVSGKCPRCHGPLVDGRTDAEPSEQLESTPEAFRALLAKISGADPQAAPAPEPEPAAGPKPDTPEGMAAALLARVKGVS